MNIEVQDQMQKIEFSSLEDFYKYITNTPLNDTFKFKSLSSVTARESFCGTKSFEEAVELFKNGWLEMSERLSNRLKADGKFEPTMTYRNVQSVQGYHPIVPLYLMGIPNNMITKKIVPMKQKVVTLNKSLDYSARVKTEQIVEESIKAFRIIQKIESQNYRVNLNLVVGVSGVRGWSMQTNEKYFTKIRLKSANEKLNISKLSFPLVHPSMLRRLYFRFIEVHPPVSYKFKDGYGIPQEPSVLRAIWPDDILLPQFINKDIEKINTLEDLENL